MTSIDLRQTKAILDTESEDDEDFPEADVFSEYSPSQKSPKIRHHVSSKIARSTTLGSTLTVSSNLSRSGTKLKRPGSSIELPGAKITAYAMGICTRMRLMDDINWE